MGEQNIKVKIYYGKEDLKEIYERILKKEFTKIYTENPIKTIK